ncbi:MAG: PAS domain-containing protein, partial [Bacteroidota bacterium]
NITFRRENSMEVFGQPNIDSWYVETAKRSEHPVIIFSIEDNQVWFANKPAETLAQKFFTGEKMTGFFDFVASWPEVIIPTTLTEGFARFYSLIGKDGNWSEEVEIQLSRIPPFDRRIIQVHLQIKSSNFASTSSPGAKQLPINTILSTVGFGCYEWSAKDRSFYMDDQMYEIYGIPKGTTVNSFTTLNELIHPDDREKMREEYNRLSELKGPPQTSSMIYRILKGDSYRYIHARRIYYLDEFGQFERLVGIVQDVTEQELMKERLYSQENAWNLLSEAVISVDDKLCIKSWNQGATEMYGWRTEEVLGRKIAEILPTEYISETRAEVFEKFLKNNAWSGEVIQPHRSGRPIHILSSVKALIDPRTGQSIGSVGVNRDISAVRQATKGLEESQKRQALINRVALVGIWYFDMLKGVLHWDDVMLKLYGIERADFTQRADDWSTRVHPEDRVRADQAMHEALANDLEQSTEFRIILPDRSIRYIRGMAVGVKNEDGDLIQVIGINWDVTSEREAEKIRLETLQLQQKNKELEQFAYVASHDLQEPLQTIRSFIKLLEKDLAREKLDLVPVYMKYIEQVSQRMSNLVKGLLDYSRIGRSNALEMVDTKKLVQDVIADFKEAQKNAKATIVVGDLPTIETPQMELRILFQNLISNALKFRQINQAPYIRVDASQNEEEWLFSVSDNGIGVPETQFEEIFVLFKRLHPRKQYEGTGIGLAHCQKIVDMLGGRLWLESEPHLGSTFYFTIPVLINEAKT